MYDGSHIHESHTKYEYVYKMCTNNSSLTLHITQISHKADVTRSNNE